LAGESEVLGELVVLYCSWQGKVRYSEKTCPIANLFTHKCHAYKIYEVGHLEPSAFVIPITLFLYFI
jgi:hypothetical protein